jgi:hypothetical protein
MSGPLALPPGHLPIEKNNPDRRDLYEDLALYPPAPQVVAPDEAKRRSGAQLPIRKCLAELSCEWTPDSPAGFRGDEWAILGIASAISCLVSLRNPGADG